MKLAQKDIKILSDIAKDIINLKLEEDNVKQAYTKFYRIMRKYGIKQGTKTKGGDILQCNPEWVMCEKLFQDRIDSTYQLLSIFSCPKDLSAY